MCASSHDNLNGRTSATEVSQSIAGAGAAAAAAQACLQRRQGQASRHAIATDEFLLPDSELSESSPRRKPPGFLHYKKLAMTMQLCGWAVHAQCVVSSFGACSVQRAAQARVARSPEASMLGDQAEGEDTSEQLPCPCEACKAAFATMKAGRVAVDTRRHEARPALRGAGGFSHWLLLGVVVCFFLLCKLCRRVCDCVRVRAFCILAYGRYKSCAAARLLYLCIS